MNRTLCCFAICYLALFFNTPLEAQRFEGPGHSIGHVSTQGNLIVMELNEGVLGKANMFDLSGRTLRFIPDGARYRIDNQPLQWDSDFGTEMKSPEVAIHAFAFPFSGKQWKSFVVGTTGNISFGTPAEERSPTVEASDRRPAGISVARFAQLADAASSILETQPAICVFFKPRTSGAHYVKELQDRVVVTWDLTEPFGNIQDFTWFKTKNLFQAVLHKDGLIEMSYREVAAKDAIVGLFPVLDSGSEKILATIGSVERRTSGSQSTLRDLKVSVVGGLFLKVSFETYAPIPHEGDPKAAGSVYRVYFDTGNRQSAPVPGSQVVWTIRGFNPRNGSEPGARYVGFRPGVMRNVEVSGNTISLRGTLPPELRDPKEIVIRGEIAESKGNFDGDEKLAEVGPSPIRLTGISNPEVDLSSLSRRDGPFSIVYEAFHYLRLPKPRDMACTVIQGLGDKFDFLAYYSDFRVDNQEAGTPSNGPVGGHVTGIGQDEQGVEDYCSKGRFQWEFIQPVYVGANQMQEYPPQNAPIGNDHDITFYAPQLSERADGKMMPYNYAMSQIGHEMGHRWAAFVSAKVGNERIDLGPVHWDMGLQAPVAFPYQRPTEASSMGGGVWQDNQDGTFTQLDDNYYVPATGHSYLDLYLMGLISRTEVPDFFILQDMQPVGHDANGHRIFKAKRVKLTVQDVIAAEGPRIPDVDHSQKEFNTGMVVVVEHGRKPSPELIERANGIREQWMKYWAITSGHRSVMTTNP